MAWRRTGEDSNEAPRHELTLSVLPGLYAICRLPLNAEIDWAAGELVSVIRSRRDLQGTTVICDETVVPAEGVEADRGWHALRFEGLFGFGEIGVLNSVLGPLARARVPVVSVSTFETDYVLIKAHRFDRVQEVLREAGHEVVEDSSQ